MQPEEFQPCAACLTPLKGSAKSGLLSPQYITCRRCGTIQLRPLPAVEANEAFEGAGAAEEMAAMDDERSGYLRRRLDLLVKPMGEEPASSGAPRLLDVGCSTGRLMGMAASDGWDVSGIELSSALAAEAHRHLPDARIITGDIMEMEGGEAGGPFDAVTALDVIEHVLDPRQFLEKIHGLLTPGGQLLLQTPNGASLRSRLQRRRWNMLIPEYHFHLFSPRGLAILLSASGFSLTHLSTASGTGRESGFGASVAPLKEAALSVALLGNAIVLTARRVG